MRVALYLRVSTTRQETKNQRRQLIELCRCENWQITRDYDESRPAEEGREQLALALTAAEHHAYDLLLFWSLDRLSREGPLKRSSIWRGFPALA